MKIPCGWKLTAVADDWRRWSNWKDATTEECYNLERSRPHGIMPLHLPGRLRKSSSLLSNVHSGKLDCPEGKLWRFLLEVGLEELPHPPPPEGQETPNSWHWQELNSRLAAILQLPKTYLDDKWMAEKLDCAMLIAELSWAELPPMFPPHAWCHL